MTLAQVDWKSISSLSGPSLKSAIFDILSVAALEIQSKENDDIALLSTIPRLSQIIENSSELSGFQEALSALARAVGLWNYIDRSAADARDSIVSEAANIHELEIVLHREQLVALNSLRAGNNLVLSAPTSFGKSILIDALLLDERYHRVAIVLPTIALLDEFRRRLVKRFGARFDILTHHSETSSRSDVIFLGTQERLINREDVGKLDLVVVDEFYKLDPSRRDERSAALNSAVYRLLKRAKQFFFLGPNISKIVEHEESEFKFSFLRTRFSTVAVDTYDLTNAENREERLQGEIRREENWPALIFASSPDKANKLAAEIFRRKIAFGNGRELANWIQENYGRAWQISEAVRLGIGIHHGRIPRALASRFVAMFNEKVLPILVCTSTLIEGVNTAAKSVMIYDKKIARENFDFFTFSNIRGRAGRLGQHHVGRVFLFHNPPDQNELEVAAPVFDSLENAPDELILHIDQVDASQNLARRMQNLVNRVGLSFDEVKRFSSIKVDTLLDLRDAVKDAVKESRDIGWTGYPSYGQIKAICQILCAVKNPHDFGCASPKQLTMYINKLRSSRKMKDFFSWFSENYTGEPQNYDNIFKFLRASEFNLPELFAVIEAFVRAVGVKADYSLFLADLPRWFRPEPLKILEEHGIPIQISERFFDSSDSTRQLEKRLLQAARHDNSGMTALERQWVIDALPE
jgi:hypothetical protein